MKTNPAKPSPRTHFEQIPVDVVKKIAVEDESGKKPTVTKNRVVVEPTAKKTEPYSMPLSSLCWTGH